MTNQNKLLIRGKVWKYPGPAGWFFVNMGKTESKRIQWVEGIKKVGWGYIPVMATLGKTTWETTLFPSKEGHYMIAIKAIVRKKERVSEGDKVSVAILLQD